MNCPNCHEDLLCAPLSINDIAVCPECGEISVVAVMAPLKFRIASEVDCAELHRCENGHKILMYSSLLKAQRKGLSSSPGNA